MKKEYPELDLILEKSTQQNEIYKPSSFWLKASEKIVEEIKEFGVENFRRLKTPLSFFVPNYGIPTNSFTSEIKDNITNYLETNGTKKQGLAMEEFLSGYFHALSDYRVFIASNDETKKPKLNNFSESLYGNPLEQFEFNERKYSRSSLNYILGICFLKKHLEINEKINTVLEIGGGFGTLGEILNLSDDIKYINIDIPPISFVSWNYLKNLFKDDMEPYINNSEKISIDNLKRCSVFNSWDIEKLIGKIDLFVNFISFQEMEPEIVENYLRNVKRLNSKWVLLRNIREGKQIKKKKDDLGVEVPVKKDDYFKMLENSYDLISTNVFPFGYKTVDGFHSELLVFKRKK